MALEYFLDLTKALEEGAVLLDPFDELVTRGLRYD